MLLLSKSNNLINKLISKRLNRRQAEEFYEIYKRIFVEAEFMVFYAYLNDIPLEYVFLGNGG